MAMALQAIIGPQCPETTVQPACILPGILINIFFREPPVLLCSVYTIVLTEISNLQENFCQLTRGKSYPAKPGCPSSRFVKNDVLPRVSVYLVCGTESGNLR